MHKHISPHGDYDHMGEAINLVENFKVEKEIFNCGPYETLEKEIINKYNLINIDVLKVGYHGSKTSNSKSFVNEINPKYSIISVGKKNHYGHPNKEVLDNLGNSKIYRTNQDGTIMF